MASLAVSVIIPTYNRAALLARAVASALAATRPGDEVLVVDDGSTDATEVALAPFRERVRYLPVPHGGAGAARNHGVRAARNPLVAFLDSDDEWMPDILALQRTLLERRPEVVFSFSDFAVRYPAGGEVRRYLVRWHGDARGWDAILGPGVPFSAVAPLPVGRGDFAVHVGDLYPAMLAAPYVCTITAVARRDLAGTALWFPEDLPLYEDYDCFARLARVGPAAYLDCETAWNWGHAGPRLTDHNQYTCLTEHLAMLERIWGRDAAFMAGHREHLLQVRAALHVRRARWLLKEGRTREARADLRLAAGGPLGYRALAALPSWLVPGRLLRRLRDLRRLTAAPARRQAQ
ncbi:MAG TPA: glycosyltransferase [Thermomicrobiales bacterium]|nr:glycosyltransferase [Thermomicrobiales bacterium]